jgi:hypothetical protein
MKTFRCPVCLLEFESASDAEIELRGVPNCRNCDRTMVEPDHIVCKTVDKSLRRALKLAEGFLRSRIKASPLAERKRIRALAAVNKTVKELKELKLM